MITSVSPEPTLVPCPMPQTLIFQVVRFSGISNSTSAIPAASVCRLATQSAVSANFERTVGLAGLLASGLDPPDTGVAGKLSATPSLASNIISADASIRFSIAAMGMDRPAA